MHNNNNNNNNNDWTSLILHRNINWHFNRKITPKQTAFLLNNTINSRYIAAFSRANLTSPPLKPATLPIKSLVLHRQLQTLSISSPDQSPREHFLTIIKTQTSMHHVLTRVFDIAVIVIIVF
jgi:hypothetical protein